MLEVAIEEMSWLVAKSWLPFTASVLLVDSVPAATLTILRSLPKEPTDTVLATFATEFAPMATELLLADALVPIATLA